MQLDDVVQQLEHSDGQEKLAREGNTEGKSCFDKAGKAKGAAT